jgi:pimeloyl-ACP methyl ester carboxylesterase
LDGLPAGASVVILLHGYRYDPSRIWADPHRLILSPGADPVLRNTPAWPRRLGFSAEARNTGKDTAEDAGLCITFGWRACGTIWSAHAEAARAGLCLAHLIREIATLRPGTKVGLMAHSLGARVALAALPQLDAGDVGRIVLLAGAEFQDKAEASLASPAGRLAEVLNVTSRENDLFDFLFECALMSRSRTLGSGLSTARSVTLQIDHAAHRAGLAALGYPIAAKDQRMCHWSAYLRPGLFPLYRAFLNTPERLPLSLMQWYLQQDQSPRWSRMLQSPFAGRGIALQ